MIKHLIFAACIIGNITYSFAQSKEDVTFTLYLNKPVQQIRNIGASGCWYSEEIGKHWPANQKNRIAELLFSRETDKAGQPRGIGLSAFRFNIGAGTAEQGSNSGIRDTAHRVEGFLTDNGTYNWNKQQGYIWMLRQAKAYGVKDLIAFLNSPPVQLTKNSLGFKLVNDGLSNLKEDKYEAYGNYLVDVMKYFDTQKLHFNYISPVNEPQWDWTGKMGEAKQEGSPWQNEEIYKAVIVLNHSLENKKSSTKILITEAAMLNHLYAKNVKASRQIESFWNPASNLYLGNLSHVTPFVEGHGYFTEKGDSSLLNARQSLKDTLKRYNAKLEYWQSEYSMLGDGYKESTAEKRTAIDCALFLAKVIHHDFAVGNATAWHYWNAYEPGSADFDTRYYLIAMNSNRAYGPSNFYTVTKNLWALGHYSLFVRPGMYRIETGRNDKLTEMQAAQQIMITAFKDSLGKTLIVNAINYSTEDKNIKLVQQGLKGKPLRLSKNYLTSGKAGDDLKLYTVGKSNYAAGKESQVKLPARSISTFVYIL